MLSRWSFGYLTPLVDKANSIGLGANEAPPVEVDDECVEHLPRFEREWARLAALATERGDGSVPSLFQIYWNIDRSLILSSAACELVHKASLFALPLVLQELVRFVALRDQSLARVFGLIAAACAANIVGGLVRNRGQAILVRWSTRMASTVTGGVYTKRFRMSAAAGASSHVGNIMNLLGQDLQRILYILQFVHILWSAPLQLLVVLGLLADLVGVLPMLPAAGVLLLTVFAVNGLNGRLKKLEARKAVMQDARAAKFTESLSGMRVIKLFGWEAPLCDRIRIAREEELKIIWRVSLLRAVLSFVFLLTPMLMAVVTFYTYLGVNDGRSMSAVQVFGTIALVGLTKMPLFMLPVVLSTAQASLVSFARLSAFFSKEEAPTLRNDERLAVGEVVLSGSFSHPEVPGNGKRAAKPAPEAKSKPAQRAPGEADSLLSKTDVKAGVDATDVQLHENGAPAEEADGDGAFCLRDLDCRVAPGALVQVIGEVGAGKTSLLSAVLGGMLEVQGEKTSTASLHGRVAYAAQAPWVRNTTVRDNILFGQPFEEDWYNEVVSCCALLPDLQQLPDGDATEIGERGVTLSGGQKARISLARAVYSRPDIALLDDVLSAVDAHVAAKLYQEVVRGLLQQCTVILVTHQVQYLQDADVVWVLHRGRMTHVGSYSEISAESAVLDDFAQQRQRTNSEAGAEAEMEAAAAAAAEADARKRADADGSADIEAETGSGLGEEDAAAPEEAAGASGKASETAPKGAPRRLMREEVAVAGGIPVDVFRYYLGMFGGPGATRLYWPVIAFVYVVAQGAVPLSDWWLSRWTQDSYERGNEFYMVVYGGIVAGAAALGLVRVRLWADGARRSARGLHESLIAAVFAGTMRYFETTPQGRLTDAVSKDLAFSDGLLPMLFDNVMVVSLNILGLLIFVGIITPWFFVPVLPFAALFLRLQRRFLRTSRPLHRQWLSSMWPLYGALLEDVGGAESIRAFRAEEQLRTRFFERIELVNRASYISRIVIRWLETRMDLVTALLTALAAALVIVARDNLSPGEAGASLSFSAALVGMLGVVCTTAAFAETFMTGVQRMRGLMDIPAEQSLAPPQEQLQGRDGDSGADGGDCGAEKDGLGLEAPAPPLPELWPAGDSSVEFDDVWFRYDPSCPDVLRGVSFRVPAGAKVGVVGRTGAGKSSLMAALFRLAETRRGRVLIGGVAAARVPLARLRAAMACIPQDPTLFEGTLRYNLDPFDEHTDDVVWHALDQCGMADAVRAGECGGGAEGSTGLDTSVKLRGSNFSAGERQLLCLARALLRGARILVLDEATASVDPRADAAVQTMLRHAFAQCTVLTIAHRLHTIAESDYVLVMDRGRAAEFAPPAELLARDESLYAALCRQAATTKEEKYS